MIKGIDKGIRLTNYITDIFIVYILWYLLFSFTQSYFVFYIGFQILIFLYYFLFEFMFGKTVGKMITKTRVVKVNGQKPSVYNLLLRSFCRLIPIDTLSYLFGYERGFHDIMSNTRLLKEI